jgi:3D-(3,5/4)-trihydroxycyclohexane-1,2-dione acylhydrolase (decyclizing)
MRVLVSPSETGAVTLALPQDVQAEAWDYPTELFERRIWNIPRPRADRSLLGQAASWIRESRAPLIVAGGGVIYSEATAELEAFAEKTGIAVAETQAGKGAMHHDHRCSLGAMGVTGTLGANLQARDADLVIGIGTRYSDFTTASKTAFAHPDVRFLNINIADFDAQKHSGLGLVADARVTLEELGEQLADWKVSADYSERVASWRREWDTEVDRIYDLGHGPLPSQGEVIGRVNRFARDKDVVVCAAGSLPGDLHKLWRSRDPKSYHTEYGYSCMGYELAGGLGVKMADPDREVYVMVGDASWLMMAQEIVTAVQEGIKLTVILIDNHGYASIGGLSKAVGSDGFGTKYRFRDSSGKLTGETLPVDYAANAKSMGAHALTARTISEFEDALQQARDHDQTTVIVVETDRRQRVAGYESWWDVPVAEVSENPEVRAAREAYDAAVSAERYFL